jgi:flagellar hook-associated protein 1 FlgK
MPGLNSLYDIGRSGLLVNQTAIEIVGNNIANVDTPGYSRREVLFEESESYNFKPGQMGTGVEAKEVIRHFDEFIEHDYNAKSSMRDRWDATYEGLRSVENLFNEAETAGMNEALSEFWQEWQELSKRPEDYSAREALLGKTQNLLNNMKSIDDDLERMRKQSDEFIEQEVAEINKLTSEIATINGQIKAFEVEGVNNANEMRDQRAMLMRSLAEKIDIEYYDSSSANLSIFTKAGHTLVDGSNSFELKFEDGRTVQKLDPDSVFEGQCYVDGSDAYEYTLVCIAAGDTSGVPGTAAEFQVSIDGGLSFLKDRNGDPVTIYAGEDNNKAVLGDIKIFFGDAESSTASPINNNISVGDNFTVMPKTGVYWYENTSSSMNITPLITGTGADNERRMSGGSLSGMLLYRDHYVGKYQKKMDAFAESLAWEVNRFHTQGAGLSGFKTVLGSAITDRSDTALTDARTGLFNADRLQDGSFVMHVYDADGDVLESRNIDFTSVGGSVNFDPSVHSLDDVADAITATFAGSGGNITATVANNQLHITSNNDTSFQFGNDTSGLLAAVGVNTFFSGNTAGDISVNYEVQSDLGRIACGHVNGVGEFNPGDNTQAQHIAGLQHNEVNISSWMEGTSNLTIDSYYNTLVAGVGGDTANAEFNLKYQSTLAGDLNTRQQEIAGVNLDEEMTNLVKFQHSYTACAKLITSANKMFDILMGLKN